MAHDPSSKSSTPLPPEILDAAKNIIARYLEEHGTATFVELAKVLRKQKAAGNIAISNSQIKAAIEQLDINSIFDCNDTEGALSGNDRVPKPGYITSLMVHVNKFLDVIYDEQAKRAQVLVNGKPFLHCSFIVAEIASTDRDIQSIDDLAQYQDARILEGNNVRNYLTPTEEVFAHASNLQAWAEHGYDTRLLHSNIAFPLLEELASAGDEVAKRVLGLEVASRIKDGVPAVRIFLLGEYGYMITDPQVIHELSTDPIHLIGAMILLARKSGFMPSGLIETCIAEFFPALSIQERSSLLSTIQSSISWSKKAEAMIELLWDDDVRAIADYLSTYRNQDELDILDALCLKKQLDPAVMMQLARHRDPGIRGIIAQRADLPDEIISFFVNEEQYSEHHEDSLDAFYANESERVQLQLLRHGREDLMGEFRPLNIAYNLSHSADASIRLEVANHPSLLDAVYHEGYLEIIDDLCKDSDPLVADAARACLKKVEELKEKN